MKSVSKSGESRSYARLLPALLLGVGIIGAACGGTTATPASSSGAAVAAAPSSVAASAPASAQSVQASSAPASSAAATSSAPPVASSAPATASAAAKPAAGKVVIGLGSLPIGMDPTTSLAIPDFYGEAEVFDALTDFDYSQATPALKPALALSWAAKDPTTWEFKLRPNVKFQNGDPFTADDVKFTFDRELNPDNKLATASRLTTVKEVRVIDPMTVDVLTKDIDPLLPKTFSSLFIVPGKYFQQVGDKAFNLKPVGTGWYTVQSYTPKDSLVLISNDSGWRGVPKSHEIDFKSIPEEATRTAALKTGDIDMAVALGTDSAATVKDIATVVSFSSGTMNAIYMQPEGPKAGPLADKRVRQAMIQAVDRDSIAKNIMGGLVQPATQSIPSNVVGYNPAVNQLPFDLNKAQALMSAAGVKPFDIELGANYGGFVNTKLVDEAYQAFEAKIGVNVKISALDLAAYLQDFRSYNRPPLWNQYLAWTPNLDASLQFQWFLSSKGPDKFMDNQNFDNLYKQAAGELDDAKRTKELQDAEATLVDEAVAVYFYENPSIYGVAKGVQGFAPRPDSVIDTFKLSKS